MPWGAPQTNGWLFHVHTDSQEKQITCTYNILPIVQKMVFVGVLHTLQVLNRVWKQPSNTRYVFSQQFDWKSSVGLWKISWKISNKACQWYNIKLLTVRVFFKWAIKIFWFKFTQMWLFCGLTHSFWILYFSDRLSVGWISNYRMLCHAFRYTHLCLKKITLESNVAIGNVCCLRG